MFFSVLKQFFRLHSTTDLEKKIGYSFHNSNLLNLAITHRSVASESSKSYERLEFLGDSILQMVTSEYLYTKYPKKSEGELTVLRSVIVNRDSIYKAGLSLKIQQHLNIKKNVDITNTPTLKTVLSNTVEAIIGAIYLDGGISAARSFIYKWIIKKGKEETLIADFNYKGQLIELCLKDWKESPVFQIENVVGPEHARVYTASVTVHDKKIGIGKGLTKKAAEQKAAEAALTKLLSNSKNKN